MGRGIITASRTACLRAEHEVASRGEKCARLFSVGSEIAKNRFRDPGHSLPGGIARSVRRMAPRPDARHQFDDVICGGRRFDFAK